jgi:hypothetical protein
MPMRNNYKYFALLLLFITISTLTPAQEIWKEESYKDGITIYSGMNEGSDFKSIKAQMLVKGSVHSFVAILQDIENMPDWGYKMNYTELLERAGDTIQIYYAEVTSPFPFDNRDGIYLNIFRWDSTSKNLHVENRMLPDYLGRKDNIVRLEGGGYWNAKVLDNDMLDISFCLQVNPGGNIPAWLVNIMIDTMPFSTMYELRRVMGEKKYEDRNFDFIH